MTARRCVELTAVFDDGTVERATGPGLSDWWREAMNHNGECEIDGVEWATTKPMRRVTVVRGRWDPGDYDESPCIDGEPGYGAGLDSILPDVVMRLDRWRTGLNVLGEKIRLPERGPLCDYRIVVEAVPVEGDR